MRHPRFPCRCVTVTGSNSDSSPSGRRGQIAIMHPELAEKKAWTSEAQLPTPMEHWCRPMESWCRPTESWYRPMERWCSRMERSCRPRERWYSRGSVGAGGRRVGAGWGDWYSLMASWYRPRELVQAEGALVQPGGELVPPDGVGHGGINEEGIVSIGRNFAVLQARTARRDAFHSCDHEDSQAYR